MGLYSVFGWNHINTFMVPSMLFYSCYYLRIYNEFYKERYDEHYNLGGVIILLSTISALLNDGRNITWSVGKFVFHFTGLGETTDNEFYIGFPFAINIAFSGVLFIFMGLIFRKIYEVIKKETIWLMISGVIAIIVGSVFFYLNRGNEVLIAMSYAHYGNYFLFILTAILLSFATLILSRYIDNRLFAKFGQYTLAIHGFHLTLTFVGNQFVNIIHLGNANLKAIVVGTITLALSCLVIPVIRYIDSNLLGERKL